MQGGTQWQKRQQLALLISSAQGVCRPQGRKVTSRLPSCPAAQIVAQRQTFDEDPSEFKGKYQDTQQALTNRIVEASKLIKKIEVGFREQKMGEGCQDESAGGMKGWQVAGGRWG